MDISLHQQVSDKGKCWWAPSVDAAGQLANGSYWQGGLEYPYSATDLATLTEGDRLFGRPEETSPLLVAPAGQETAETKLLAWVHDAVLHLITHLPAGA